MSQQESHLASCGGNDVDTEIDNWLLSNSDDALPQFGDNWNVLQSDTAVDGHAGSNQNYEINTGNSSEQPQSNAINVLEHIKDQDSLQRALERKLKFANMEQALSANGNMANYEPPPDPSRPVTDGDLAVYVLLLLEAVHDMSSPEDNPKLLDEWNRTLKSSSGNIELGLWRLLEKILLYHERPDFLGEKVNTSARNKFTTFAEHIEVLSQILRRQKTICGRLIAEETLVTLVDDPVTQEKKVRKNRATNGYKKEVALYNSQAVKGLKQNLQKGATMDEDLKELAGKESPRFIRNHKRAGDADGKDPAESAAKRSRGEKSQDRHSSVG